MKKLLLIVAIFCLFACSEKPKEDKKYDSSRRYTDPSDSLIFNEPADGTKPPR